MPIKLNTASGGGVILQGANTASDKTITVPATDGTVVLVGTALTSGTAVTASGTSIDFTGIPSWAKRITVMLSGVSTNGTSTILIQLGDSGGIETTGYLSHTGFAGGTNSAGGASSTAGFIVFGSSAANIFYGHATFTLSGSNLWVGSHIFGLNATTIPYSVQGGGNKTLSDTLDRVRITTVNGTDAFDAGTINIMYEG